MVHNKQVIMDNGPLFVDDNGNQASSLNLCQPLIPLNFSQTNRDQLMSFTIFNDSSFFTVSLLKFTVDDDSFNQMARRRAKLSLDIRVRVAGFFNSDVQLFAIVLNNNNSSSKDQKRNEIIRFSHRCQTIPELDESPGTPSAYLLTIGHVKKGTVVEIGILVPSDADIVHEYNEYCVAERKLQDYKSRQRMNIQSLTDGSADDKSQPSFRSNSKSTINFGEQEYQFSTNVHSVHASFCEMEQDVELNDHTPIEVNCALAYNPVLHQLRQLRTFRRFHFKMEQFIRHTYGNLCGDAYMSRVQSAACQECRKFARHYDEGSTTVRTYTITEGMNLSCSIVNSIEGEGETEESKIKDASKSIASLSVSRRDSHSQAPSVAIKSLTNAESSVSHHSSLNLESPVKGSSASILQSASQMSKTRPTTAAVADVDDNTVDYLSGKPFFCLRPECAGKLIDCDYRNPRYLAHLIDGLVGPYAGQSLVDSGVRFHRVRWKERDKLMESRFDKLELFYEEKFYYELQLDKFVCPRCKRVEPYLDARFRKLCIAQKTTIEYESECISCKVVFEPEHLFRMERWEKRMNTIEMVRTRRLQNLQETLRRIDSYKCVPYQFTHHPKNRSWNGRSSRRVTQYRRILQCDGSSIDWAKVFADSQVEIEKRKLKANNGIKGILKQQSTALYPSSQNVKTGGITFGSSSGSVPKSSMEKLSILSMISGMIDGTPGAQFGGQSLEATMEEENEGINDALPPLPPPPEDHEVGGDEVMVNVSIVESGVGDPKKDEEEEVDFDLLRFQQQAAEVVVSTPRDTVPQTSTVEVHPLTPSEPEDEQKMRRDRRNDIGLYGSGNHTGGDVIYFATEEDAIGKVVQAVKSASPNGGSFHDRRNSLPDTDEEPVEITVTEPPPVSLTQPTATVALTVEVPATEGDIDVRSINGNLSPLIREMPPKSTSAKFPVDSSKVEHRNSKILTPSRKNSVASHKNSAVLEPGSRRNSSVSKSPSSRSPSKRHRGSSRSSGRLDASDSLERKPAAYLENDDEIDPYNGKMAFATYFWVSGVAGVVPPNAVQTGTTVDNARHNNYSEASDDYEDDYEENIIQCFTVRIRCMYNTESNTLEEYDLNKLHHYSVHRNHYMERYFLGVCRRGSGVQAMCMVPSSMKLGSNLRQVDCFENREKVIAEPLEASLEGSNSRVVEPYAMAQIVEDNEDEYGEGEDAEEEVDAMEAACALVTQSTDANSSSDGPAKHKTASKTTNSFVTVAVSRCEYLVEVLTPLGKPEPSEESMVQTAMSKSLVTQIKESVSVAAPPESSEVIFDDSLVFMEEEEDSTIFAKLSGLDGATEVIPEPTSTTTRDGRSIGISDVEPLQPSQGGSALSLHMSRSLNPSLGGSVTSRKSGPPPVHLTQMWDDHFDKLTTPSLILSNTILTSDYGNSNRTHVETCVQKKLSMSLMVAASQREDTIVEKYTWRKAEPNWLGSENLLHVPKNCMFVANILNTGNAHHRNKNKFKSNPVEYVFVVRTLLHNVNIVTGTFIYKKPVIINRGLLSRLSFMLTSTHTTMIAGNGGPGSGGAFGNMSYANAIEAALNAQNERKVELFASSVGKDKDKPKVHYCTKVTTVVEHPTTVAAPPAQSTGSVADARSNMNQSTTSTSTAGGQNPTNNAEEIAKNTQQVTEIIGPLDHGLLAVFYFNNCLYYIPIRDVEFLCICKDN